MKVLAAVFSCAAYLFFFQIYPNHTNTNELSRLLLTSAIVRDLNAGKLVAALRSVVKPARQAVTMGEQSQGNLLAELWKDLRYGMRLLRLNRAFTIVAVLSLALGIGANTAIFQLLDAVRLRTLPVKDPQQLAQVRVARTPQGRTGNFTGDNPELTNAIWENLQDSQQAFSGIAAWSAQRLNLSQGGEARYARVLFVSGAFFDTLGVQPAVGRLISPADDRPGCAASGVVISSAFQQSEFAGKASALGAKLTMEGIPFEIVGVTPPSFYGVEVGRNFDVALPLCAEKIVSIENARMDDLRAWWLASIGRLKTGWTVEQASAHFATLSSGIFKETLPPEYDAGDAKAFLGFKLEALPAGSIRDLLRKLKVEVIEVPLLYWTGPADCLHLMSFISMLDVNLAVVYSKLLPVPLFELLRQRGIELIEIPEEEYATQACNVLAIAPRSVVMLKGNPITRSRLVAAGCKVQEFSGDEISLKGSGGPTCLTRPLFRE